MKLLLDENLSPKVAGILKAEGIDAIHLRDRGMLGATDPEVLARALVEDRILVTMNVGDFEKLANAAEIHAGIVLVTPGGLARAEQLEVLHNALAQLAGEDMVNRVLRVNVDGQFSFDELPTTE